MTRYQVFVSSTYADLIDERSAAIDAILRMGHFPSGMELFPAADEAQLELIKRIIDQSDIYIVIIGGRYGSLTPDGISYTEAEYEYAKSIGKPILGFVHDDPQQIPSGLTEKDPELVQKLEMFRTSVKRKMIRSYRSPAQLAYEISSSLNSLVERRLAGGWVPANLGSHQAKDIEIKKLKREIEHLRDGRSAEETEIPGTIPASLDIELTLTCTYAPMDGSPRYTKFETTRPPMQNIFGEFGEQALSEKSEWRIRSYIEENMLECWIGNSGETTESIRLSDSAWRSIIVYLRGLGLIEEGTRPRAPDDDGTYWKLTEAGESELFRTHAMFQLMTDNIGD